MKYFATLICLAHMLGLSAQNNVGVGTTVPHPNAVLDVSSNSKGILIPRLTTAQRLAINPNPSAQALLVYDQDSSAFFFWTGNLWSKLVSGNVNTGPWVISGNTIFNSNNGNVGIGTPNPQSFLHVDSGNVVFSKPGDAQTFYFDPLTANPAAPPLGGAGNLMYWYADKAAFRAGGMSLLRDWWSSTNTGDYSFAANINNKASGYASTAFGNNCQATGRESFTAGSSNRATGTWAASFGEVNISRGTASFTAGRSLFAKNVWSIVLGSANDLGEPELNPDDFPVASSRLFQVGNGGVIGGPSRSNAITILWNGNVGLGNVNSPNAPLQLNNQVQNRKIVLYESANNDHQYYGFGINGSLLRYQTAGIGDDHVFYAGESSTSSNELLRIKGNGNVGIGTTSPNAPLQFSNNIANRKIVLYDNNNNNHQYYGFGINGGTLRYQVDATGADHVFFAGLGAASSAELMRIKGSGNVGVGASDPVYRLDVNGRMRIRSGGDVNNTAGIWLNNVPNTVSPAFIGMEADDAVGFYGNTTPNGWGIIMKIGTGNVGIGTSIPSQKLHVIGNILATGTITPSDLRYKTDITKIQEPLSRLSAIHGVTYFMNRNDHPEWQFDSTLQYGLIAQEVEKVFPEMVKTISADGYKGLDYPKLIPVLVEAIKEQQTNIERQNEQLSKQQQVLEALEKRLNNLEQKLVSMETR